MPAYSLDLERSPPSGVVPLSPAAKGCLLHLGNWSNGACQSLLPYNAKHLRLTTIHCQAASIAMRYVSGLVAVGLK